MKSLKPALFATPSPGELKVSSLRFQVAAFRLSPSFAFQLCCVALCRIMSLASRSTMQSQGKSSLAKMGKLRSNRFISNDLPLFSPKRVKAGQAIFLHESSLDSSPQKPLRLLNDSFARLPFPFMF